MRLIDELSYGESGQVPPRRSVRPGYGWRTLPVRIAGAGLLAAMAWIHVHLFGLGYGDVSVIGQLFLLNGVLGSLAAALLLLAPRRWLALACLAGGVLLAGTLGALLLTLTVGLFGFTETTGAPLAGWTLGVESAGAILLLIAAAVLRGRAPH
ncbi:MAG TPA: hypothetical protein VFJ19_07965 [Nocardioidaceae bacterium]|nr:hypothetical protein [Nocardioidaceae bacterium]